MCVEQTEKRKFKEERRINEFSIENKEVERKCIESKLPYFEIKYNYQEEIQNVYDYINENVVKFRK